MVKYSVLLSVYKKDNPIWLKECIESIVTQTYGPDEFVILKDGKLGSELDNVISEYVDRCPGLFVIKGFETNRGLGPTLADGILMCKNDWIARIDADDIAAVDRCEKQIQIASEGNYQIIGSLVDEFINDRDNIVAHVNLPEGHNEIVKFSKRRNPFRHSSLVYLKDAVIKAGNYRDFYLYEDYDLFTRMIMAGARGYNIQEPLTYMRIGEDFFARRGGIKYFRSIFRLRKELYKKHYTGLWDFLFASGSNFVVCILPNFIRDWVYLNLLRKKQKVKRK